MDNLISQGLVAVLNNFEDGSLVQSAAALGISLTGVAYFGKEVYENLD